MKEFKGKVAVITGAANGFGAEFARECAAREMKVVIADIDAENLKKVNEELLSKGAETLAIVADVTLFDEVQKISNKAYEKFGQVDLLFNNAGVAVAGPAWELPVRDWEWIIGSNLYSMIYGVKAFVPRMLEQDKECYIVNTASVAGLLTTPTMPAYHTTKHAAVAFTESVYLQLQSMNSKIKMSVFCPGFVQTDLDNCDRHRPERFKIDPSESYYESESYKDGLERAHHAIRTGTPIDSIAPTVFKAIEDEQFYILTHPQYNPVAGLRVKNILEGKNPDYSIFK